MTDSIIQDFQHSSGLRSRWFANRNQAISVLDSIPSNRRGEYTKRIPMQTSKFDGGIWRVDECS